MWAILAVGLGVYGAVCFALAQMYLSPARFPTDAAVGFDPADVPTSAGPNPTWISPGLAEGHGPVFIFAHGYGGSRGDWLALAKALESEGFQSAIPSMPGQDRSPDPTVGFGLKEADVLVSTARWVRERRGRATPIVLVGLSMGGSAAWMAGERAEADAIVSEGAFPRFDEALDRWFEHKIPGVSFLFQPVVWIASARTGVRPSEIVPLDAARRWNGRPGLVIHAEHDGLFPAAFGERLAEAAGVPLWRVPESGHADVFADDPEGYVSRLAALARRVQGD